MGPNESRNKAEKKPKYSARSTATTTAIYIARMFGFLNDTTIRASDKKGFTLALPETGNQYFYIYTNIIKSQYHGDVVVPVLRTVTVKGEHGSYVSKNFERPLMFL